MNSLKLLSENSQAHPPWKNPLLPFYSLPTPLKNSKKCKSPFLLTLKIFQAPCRKEGRTLWSLTMIYLMSCMQWHIQSFLGILNSAGGLGTTVMPLEAPRNYFSKMVKIPLKCMLDKNSNEMYIRQLKSNCCIKA